MGQIRPSIAALKAVRVSVENACSGSLFHRLMAATCEPQGSNLAESNGLLKVTLTWQGQDNKVYCSSAVASSVMNENSLAWYVDQH